MQMTERQQSAFERQSSQASWKTKASCNRQHRRSHSLLWSTLHVLIATDRVSKPCWYSRCFHWVGMHA